MARSDNASELRLSQNNWQWLLVLQALAYAVGLLMLTGLVTDWGSWYSPSTSQREQTDALMQGEFALTNSPSLLKHDYCWANQQVHQVWGLGIAVWRVPFEVLSRMGGWGGFSDRLALGAMMAVVGYIVFRTMYSSLGSEIDGIQPGNDEFGLGALGAGVLTLAFPPLLNLLNCRAAIYEEVLVYAFFYALVLMCGVMTMARRPSHGCFWILSVIAGLGGFIRPTMVFYGVATMIVSVGLLIRRSASSQRTSTSSSIRLDPGAEFATGSNGSMSRSGLLTEWLRFLRMGRSNRSTETRVGISAAAVKAIQRYPITVGTCLFVSGGVLLWWTNLIRFGSGFEFGHRLNLQAESLVGSVYSTRFDYPFENESIWSAFRELLGSLFLVHKFNGSDWYAQGISLLQSPTVRWREFYFTTFDVTYLILVVSGWGIGIFAWRRLHSYLRESEPRATAREVTPTANDRKALCGHMPPGFCSLTAAVAAWSALACAPLAWFYLRSPVISSRYMMDFAPAFAAAILVIWWYANGSLYAARGSSTRIMLGLLTTLFGWMGWQSAFGQSKYGSLYGPPYSVRWEELVELRSKSNPRAVGGLPIAPGYRSGHEIQGCSIPYNGTGWNVVTGAAMPCITLFVDSPEFLELKIESVSGGKGSIPENPECIRAKVGLEFLRRELIEPTPGGWRVRFAGPTRPEYQKGLQPVFIATVPKEYLAVFVTPWVLKEVTWRPEKRD
jgi:hypothetical protein